MEYFVRLMFPWSIGVWGRYRSDQVEEWNERKEDMSLRGGPLTNQGTGTLKDQIIHRKSPSWRFKKSILDGWYLAIPRFCELDSMAPSSVFPYLTNLVCEFFIIFRGMVTIVLRRDFAIGHVPIHFPKIPSVSGHRDSWSPGGRHFLRLRDLERPVMNTQIQRVQGSVWDKHVWFRELEDYMANWLMARIVRSPKCWIVCRHIYYIHIIRSITSKSSIFLGWQHGNCHEPDDHEASSFVDISPQRLGRLLSPSGCHSKDWAASTPKPRKIKKKHRCVRCKTTAARVAATVGKSERNLHLHLPC